MKLFLKSLLVVVFAVGAISSVLSLGHAQEREGLSLVLILHGEAKSLKPHHYTFPACRANFKDCFDLTRILHWSLDEEERPFVASEGIRIEKNGHLLFEGICENYNDHHVFAVFDSTQIADDFSFILNMPPKEKEIHSLSSGICDLNPRIAKGPFRNTKRMITHCNDSVEYTEENLKLTKAHWNTVILTN